jgi:integrase
MPSVKTPAAQHSLYERCTGPQVSKKVIYEKRSWNVKHDYQLAEATLYCLGDQISGKVAEWRIAGVPGLLLRITPGRIVWYIRRRDVSLRIGDLGEVNLDTAKYYALQVDAAAGRGRDLRIFLEYLKACESGVPRLPDPYRNDEFVPPDGEPTRNPKFVACADAFSDASSDWAYRARIGDDGAVWSWRTLTHKWLEYQLPKLKLDYRTQYESYLTLKEFEIVNDKRVKDVKLPHLERLRDTILANRAKSAVHRAVEQSKNMLSWAWKHHATRSGLDEVQSEWWERWTFEYRTRERTHAPTIEEIARTLVLAETFRNLGEGEHETYPGTIGALWAVALTAQRTGALMQTRLDRLYDGSEVCQKTPKCRDLTGWQIANWNAEEMKGGKDGGRSHSLPIPPAGLAILHHWHDEVDTESEWLFPAARSKKHVTQSALNQLMYRLQGRVYDHTVKQKPPRKGKPGPKPKPRKVRRNLFLEFGIEPWTLHDARRTLTTFLDDQRLGGAATAILAHKTSGSRVDERERLAPVTQQHYNRSQKIDLKAEGMALWVEAVLKAYREEREKVLEIA